MPNQTDIPRVVSLSEAADILHMKRPNVARFLARHGAVPVLAKASGYLWAREDVERLQRERESNPTQVRANEARRKAAMARHHGNESNGDAINLGPTQRNILTSMLGRPAVADTSSRAHALRRLAERGFVTPVEGEPRRTYTLTEEGRKVALELQT